MVSKFLHELKFTTNGIRGIANDDLTPHVCIKIGQAFGHFLEPGAKVIIGTDYRVSGQMIKNALISGLNSTGVHVIDGSYTPTPALQKFVKDNPGTYDLGLIITASHNPPEFNGIKVIDADGIEIPPEKESKVEAYYKTINDKTTLVPWDQLGSLTDALGVNEYYVDSILKKVNIDQEGAKKLHIVVDPGNGATCTYIYELMARMGISRNACISDEPDGHFPNRVSEPTPDSLQELSEEVVAEGASFGIGFDGDGDRAIFIDNDGQFHWGDESFALILNDILQEYKGWVVTPVSSSVLVQEVVEAHGAKLEWTKVGSITVSRRMLELNAIIAGEENGGIFYKPHQPVRDGGMALALIVEILSKRQEEITALFKELPKYYLHKETIKVKNKRKKHVLEYIKNQTEDEERVLIDGVKIFKEEGSVLIRPSGTEPKFRSFADGKSQQSAEKLSKWGIELVKRALK